MAAALGSILGDGNEREVKGRIPAKAGIQTDSKLDPGLRRGATTPNEEKKWAAR